VKIDPVAGPLYRGAILKTWTEVRIRRLDLTKARKQAALSIAKKRPTLTESATWMTENIGHYVYRDAAITACRNKTGATARMAAAAFNLLPEDKKFGRGQKAGKSNTEIEREK
jgi:hypothetical protein